MSKELPDHLIRRIIEESEQISKEEHKRKFSQVVRVISKYIIHRLNLYDVTKSGFSCCNQYKYIQREYSLYIWSESSGWKHKRLLKRTRYYCYLCGTVSSPVNAIIASLLL